MIGRLVCVGGTTPKLGQCTRARRTASRVARNVRYVGLTGASKPARRPTRAHNHALAVGAPTARTEDGGPSAAALLPHRAPTLIRTILILILFKPVSHPASQPMSRPAIYIYERTSQNLSTAQHPDATYVQRQSAVCGLTAVCPPTHTHTHTHTHTDIIRLSTRMPF